LNTLWLKQPGFDQGLSFTAMPFATKADIFKALQTNILSLQGIKHSNNSGLDDKLGRIKHSFPNDTFPLSAVHEFLSPRIEDVAATSGFIACLLNAIMAGKGITLWISSSRKLFTPALKNFGIEPDNFIFIDLKKERDVNWAVDEALKCNSISAVIGELREIDFITSRRLQLAVENSGATGFILRSNIRNLNNTACVARWKIAALPSEPIDDLPGIGFPKWRVELLKVRNGKPGVWDVQWENGKLVHLEKLHALSQEQQKKAG